MPPRGFANPVLRSTVRVDDNRPELWPPRECGTFFHREVAEECARSLQVISPLDSAIQFFHTSAGEAYELHASFFLARFGTLLDGPAQHELRWLPALPQSPAFFHECHRWSVQQAVSRS
jgi:hypothetical protein